MKILFVSHEMSFGGSTRALISLIRSAERAGIEATVLVPKTKCKATDSLQEAGIETTAFPYSWWMRPVNSPFYIKAICKFIYTFINPIAVELLSRKFKDRFDVIHSNSSAIDIGAHIAAKTNTPHIWHFREFHGSNLNFISPSPKCWEYINSSNSMAIFVSKDLQTAFSGLCNLRDQYVIPDGIQGFSMKKANQSSKPFVFGIIGSIQPSKGIDCAIRAAAILKTNRSNDFVIEITGNDQGGYKKKLEALADRLGVRRMIRFNGFTKNATEKHYSADVELMCSLREAFGLTTAEALMAGNPVIGSRSGGTKDLIIDGKTGFLFEPNNPDDLARKMAIFLANRNLARQMSHCCHAYAMENLSEDNCFDKMLEVYKDACA